MVVTPVTSISHYKSTIEAGKPVVVDFFAEWCNPCRNIAPVLEKWSDDPKYKDAITFLKVDVDAHEDIADDANITGMPTFKFFKQGKLQNEMVGTGQDMLKGYIDKLLE